MTEVFCKSWRVIFGHTMQAEKFNYLPRADSKRGNFFPKKEIDSHRDCNDQRRIESIVGILDA
jgi:hypothetical protein